MGAACCRPAKTVIEALEPPKSARISLNNRGSASFGQRGERGSTEPLERGSIPGATPGIVNAETFDDLQEKYQQERGPGGEAGIKRRSTMTMSNLNFHLSSLGFARAKQVSLQDFFAAVGTSIAAPQVLTDKHRDILLKHMYAPLDLKALSKMSKELRMAALVHRDEVSQYILLHFTMGVSDFSSFFEQHAALEVCLHCEPEPHDAPRIVSPSKSKSFLDERTKKENVKEKPILINQLGRLPPHIAANDRKKLRLSVRENSRLPGDKLDPSDREFSNIAPPVEASLFPLPRFASQTGLRELTTTPAPRRESFSRRNPHHHSLAQQCSMTATKASRLRDRTGTTILMQAERASHSPRSTGVPRGSVESNTLMEAPQDVPNHLSAMSQISIQSSRSPVRLSRRLLDRGFDPELDANEFEAAQVLADQSNQAPSYRFVLNDNDDDETCRARRSRFNSVLYNQSDSDNA